MKHIKKFNETLKDDVKHEILSTFKTSGNLIKYENDIKNDIIFYIEQLLDEEIETIYKLAQLKKGEISKEDVDMSMVMEIGNKLNKELTDIVNKYFSLAFQDYQ